MTRNFDAASTSGRGGVGKRRNTSRGVLDGDDFMRAAQDGTTRTRSVRYIDEPEGGDDMAGHTLRLCNCWDGVTGWLL